LKLMMLLLGGIVLVMGAFVLGFTRVELFRLSRFLIVGVIMVYATLLSALGKGASGAVGAARQLQAKTAERRALRAQEEAEAAEWAAAHAAIPGEPRVTRVAPPPSLSHDAYDDFGEQPAPTPQKTGFLAKMPSLIRRADPEPELIETHGPDGFLDEAPEDDRVRAKIANAIKTRVRQNPSVTSAAHAPLTKGRGRGPDPLIVTPKGLPPEPPVTARGAVSMRAEPPVAAPVARIPQQPVADDTEENIFQDMTDWDDYGEETQAYTPVPSVQMPSSPVPQPVPQPETRKVVQQPIRKPLQPSKRAQQEAQPQLQFEDVDVDYELPPLGLLMDPANIERHHLSDEALEENARMLEAVLDDYGVKGEIVSVRPGPVVTMYELEPAAGLKASRVIGLADDIARSMSALSARVSTVPGRSVIGIELPNENREMVSFREILSTRDYGDGTQKLPLALGKDIGGDPVVANLAKMPHLLIAGTTGSGKSVAINTMILSLLYKLSPADLRLVMIDPKMLELSVYDGIPHLLSPVVTDPNKAVVALKWVVAEMEERYRKMSKLGVRNIDGYNGRVADALSRGEMFERTVQTGFDDETGEPIFETEEIQPVKMPYIVVIVDEMADLMMVAGKEIEACIQRLAQMARASGIHLIMATQRPSVDVITGTIKANFPTRISFQVTSKIDSRTILGEMGAEQLLGQGDMLYMAGGAKITRCHGPFVSDEEVEEIVTHLKAYGPPEYVGGVVQGPDDEKADNIDAVLGLNTGGNTDGEDALYDQAVGIVIRDRKCSTSYIQRKLAIGYNKAARLVEQMEDEGVVSAANHVGKREILVPEQ
jgi:S-DNA-T family DNA segregation ATPase FtsK/SpoIIIE